jgi:nicotinamide-nucleotide amidase
MTVALLSIGNELLRGEIADTNSQWLADELTQLGFVVEQIETVGDDRACIVRELRRLLVDHALLVATGGLGPTSDDVTVEAAAELLGVELTLNDDAFERIRRRVAERGGTLLPGHEKQARLPAGSEMLPNSAGTAPGFVLRVDRASAYFLPGVPHEMRTIFTQHVVPRVRGSAPNTGFALCLHTIGMGESWIAEQLLGVEEDHPGVTLRYRVHGVEVDVRVEARGSDHADARDRAQQAANDVRRRLGPAIYAEGEQTLPQLAGRAVRQRGWRLAVAESCTGGLLAQQLTALPASDYFVGGTVAYANAAKTSLLGVSEDTLRGHGAVSAEVAAEMAEGARRAFDCEVALSTTGIAGPTGATADKPVGLCHWALAYPGGTIVEQRVFRGNRTQVQQQAALAALDLLRRTLNGG